MQAMIDELAKQAAESLGQVSSKETLASFWQEYLSKNGKIPALMKNLRSVAPEERPAMGKIINELKQKVQADYDAAAAKVKNLITEMSHDLRTPLTTLLLYTEILRHRKYETTAQAEDYLAKIDTKARQLKQLSDNLFEYALVTRDTVAVLDPPARFSQIFEEPLTEMVGELQERGFACALELGEEDDTLTVKEQYVRRILDNITSNLLKYADPAQDISVRFVKENGKAGLAFENAVLPGQHRTDSTKVGLTSIETMMEKMHAACRIKQSGERFCITLLFPIEK